MNQNNAFNQNIIFSKHDVPGSDIIKFEATMQELKERKQILNVSNEKLPPPPKNSKTYQRTYVKLS